METKKTTIKTKYNYIFYAVGNKDIQIVKVYNMNNNALLYKFYMDGSGDLVNLYKVSQKNYGICHYIGSIVVEALKFFEFWEIVKL